MQGQGQSSRKGSHKDTNKSIRQRAFANTPCMGNVMRVPLVNKHRQHTSPLRCKIKISLIDKAKGIPTPYLQPNVGALIIRIGFGGIVCYYYNKEPPKPYSNCSSTYQCGATQNCISGSRKSHHLSVMAGHIQQNKLRS